MRFYLTGGTALARFHFQHRLSEDLDFFTQDAQLPYIANELDRTAAAPWVERCRGASVSLVCTVLCCRSGSAPEN
jgi:hypothetical protein